MMPGVGFIGGQLSILGGYSWPGAVDLIETWDEDRSVQCTVQYSTVQYSTVYLIETWAKDMHEVEILIHSLILCYYGFLLSKRVF